MQKSRSQLLFEHAIKYVTPFSTTLGHPWAVIPEAPGRFHPWPIHSDRFRQWLVDSFFSELGLYPGFHAVNSALTMLAARARFSNVPATAVRTRIGFRGDPRRPDAILLHLANTANELIEITPGSHRIISSEGWHFLTGYSTAALPRPARTRDALVPLLQPLLGLTGPTLHRIAIWLFAALRPSGPYPVLLLTGPAASGKSTLARILRSLLDPSATPLHQPPHSERDLNTLALHNHILAFDHVSSLRPHLADAIARLAAGTTAGIFSNNMLNEPQPLPLARPIIITAPGRRRDFAAAALHVRLHPLELQAVQPEATLDDNLAAAAPSILDALCTAAAGALSNLQSVTPVSRFADVHRWTAAAAGALGLTPAEINRALAASPLIEAIEELLDPEPIWNGTATDLLQTLQAQRVPNLPATPKGLSQQLNSAPLALFGILQQQSSVDNRRILRLTHRDSECVGECPSDNTTHVQ